MRSGEEKISVTANAMGFSANALAETFPDHGIIEEQLQYTHFKAVAHCKYQGSHLILAMEKAYKMQYIFFLFCYNTLWLRTSITQSHVLTSTLDTYVPILRC